jgi:hypothetical protein
MAPLTVHWTADETMGHRDEAVEVDRVPRRSGVLFFFLLTIILGLFSIGRLTDFNRVSADVRDLWLPNTRFLGDLNNFTSDFRAAEGTNLLACG